MTLSNVMCICKLYWSTLRRFPRLVKYHHDLSDPRLKYASRPSRALSLSRDWQPDRWALMAEHAGADTRLFSCRLSFSHGRESVVEHGVEADVWVYVLLTPGTGAVPLRRIPAGGHNDPRPRETGTSDLQPASGVLSARSAASAVSRRRHRPMALGDRAAGGQAD